MPCFGKLEMNEQLLLHRAAALGDLKKVKELISEGWEIDCEDDNGATPLFVASFKGQAEVVRFLISQGADVNKGNRVGYTSLMTASREKKLEVVKALLEGRADPEQVSESGKRAVHWALLDTAPIDSKYFETETKLVAILKLLRESGADINAKGKNGETPLIDAAWWGLVEATKYLLLCGANRDERDNDGLNAIDFAKMKIAKNLGPDINKRCELVMEILSGSAAKKSWWKFW